MKKPSKKTSEKKLLLDNLKKLSSQKNNQKRGFNPFLILLFIAALITGFYFLFGIKGNVEVVDNKVALNQVIANYASGTYSEILIDGNKLSATKKAKGSQVISNPFTGPSQIDVTNIDEIQLPPHDSLKDLGLNDIKNPTKITIKDNTWSNMWTELLPTILGAIFIIIIFFFLFGKMSGGANGPMAFIKSRAKLYDPNKDPVSFKDVAGAEEEKDELVEVVDFLKNPQKYRDLGAKIPRGILLMGPPGTGKTLLARAVAGESGVPFFSISGSEFVEMFVGVGAARVRDLFKEAKEKAPSIIFIDEIDAIGKKRSPGIGGGHDEREQTLNQILTEMDGFDNQTAVIVMAATNRADVLDKALLRPGRFDRKVVINLPNIEDRVKILEVHAKNKPLDENIKWRKLASATVGFSGADLANLLNEAAILAGKYGAKTVTEDMIQKSIEKIVLGNTKKSRKMSEQDKKLTAFHEVGHAIIAKLLPNPDPVHKISIIPRGRTGGVTWTLPDKERDYVSKSWFADEIAVLFGGRVAEEVFLGKDAVTTGAGNDIERATKIARAMITEYGFDEDLGPENFVDERVEGNYLGLETSQKMVSNATQELIDRKVSELLKSAYSRARELILKHRDLHEKIALTLLEKEEMLEEEFDAFFE